MNKDKAIQLLERLQDPEPYEPMLTKDAYDAIQMAIDALSADGDTISRKAAIGVLHEALDRVDQIADVPFGVYQNYRDKMNELPPAQPEPYQNGDLWITVPDIDKVTRIYVQESKSKFCRIFYEEQKQPEPHWIPRSERLPFAECGESNNVLTTCGHREDEDSEYRWIKMLYFNGGNWCYPTGETYLEKAYAWMPLPPVYQGE